jgi:hypothetical protein
MSQVEKSMYQTMYETLGKEYKEEIRKAHNLWVELNQSRENEKALIQTVKTLVGIYAPQK